MKYYELKRDDLFLKESNHTWKSLLVNLSNIDYFEVYENYVILSFINEQYITITKDCYNDILDFLKTF